MKSLIRSFLLVFCLGLSLSPGAYAVPATPTQRTVLVLLPFQADLPVSRLALQTLQDEFGSVNDMTLTLYYEFMDSNRFSDNAYQQQIFDLYATKYGNKPIDLVMIETETVLSAWLKQRDKIAPSAPVVYFDTLSDTFAAWALPPNVTGVGGFLDYSPSIEWIMGVRPAVNEVAVVHGAGAIDLAPDNIRPVKDLVREMGQKVHITDLSSLPLAEIKRRVAALPPHAVVLSHPFFEDATGAKYNPTVVSRELAAVSPVPVINGFDLSIGTGTIGGYMYSLERQIREAVSIGLRILRGEKVSAMPPVNDQNGPFIFDHLALQRFDIPLSALPPDSIVKNRQYSFWEIYRLQLIATGTGFVGLVLLIIFLLVLTRKLNNTRLALAQLNASLETQVHERTAMLNHANKQLQDEISERKQLAEELHRQASTDGLTGITNRRHFLELMQIEINRAIRHKYPLAIAMMDIDHFKQINDNYGHSAGDQALLAFVKNCQKLIRDIDVFARLGGDEFVIMMPHTHREQANQALERVRRALETMPLDIAGQPVFLTISAGVTILANEQESLETLLARSDLALYQAKEAGRNRVVVASV